MVAGKIRHLRRIVKALSYSVFPVLASFVVSILMVYPVESRSGPLDYAKASSVRLDGKLAQLGRLLPRLLHSCTPCTVGLLGARQRCLHSLYTVTRLAVAPARPRYSSSLQDLGFRVKQDPGIHLVYKILLTSRFADWHHVPPHPGHSRYILL
jgi:hypothetical protein